MSHSAGESSWTRFRIAVPSLRGRLLVVILTTLLCGAVVAGLVLWSLMDVQRAQGALLDQTVEEVVPVTQAERRIRSVAPLGWQTAVSLHSGESASLRPEFDAAVDDITEQLEEIRLDKDGRFVEEAMAIAAATQHWNAAIALYEAVFAADRLDTPQLTAALSEVARESDAAIKDFDAVVESSLVEMGALVEQSESTRDRGIAVTVLGLFICVAMIGWMTRSFWGGVFRAFDNTREGARRLAEGDWEHRLDTGGPTELAELGESLNAMSATLRQKHAELEYRSLHDRLTGLGNRTLMAERMERAASTRSLQVGVDALLVVDLDRFKDLNDTHGHAVGDDVLIVTAKRIAGCGHVVEHRDRCFRTGGHGRRDLQRRGSGHVRGETRRRVHLAGLQ